MPFELEAILSPAAAAALAALPWEDPERADRLLQAVGDRAAAARSPLLEAAALALPDAPDPEMALLNLERWSAALITPASTLSLLAGDPRLLADLLALFGSSRYLADILARDPTLYSTLAAAERPRGETEYAAAVEAALRSLRRPEGRRDALRRVKRREFLRIGWRDLARGAPLAEVVAEISDLADALIRGALRLAREEVDPRFPTASAAVRLAVIAMGKLGARELNYSSDVDLLFVMDSPTPQDEGHRRYAARLAETLIAVLAEETGEGRCFRVDMRLRPEGRAGSLVRSFDAFRVYYDRWAETWERQALIKARPAAGDAELGARFLALVRPVTYRRLQGATLLEDVREMRSARERKLEAAGEMEGHVKEGRGTIRDVEFTVQLLQLLFGADVPSLQVPDTLTALARLEEAGLLTPEERARFERGYLFFRAVEHRLQLLHDLPVRLLPADPRDARRLARSMRFPDTPAFLAAYREQSGGVRALAEAIHERLGVSGSDPADALRGLVLLADTRDGAAGLLRELQARRFPHAEEGLEALLRLARGVPGYPHPASTRRLFADLAPSLLDGCAAAADPGAALRGMADFADRKLLHRALYQTLLEHPGTLRDLCRFAGDAPAAMKSVLRYPELSDLVTDEERRPEVRDLAALRGDLAARLAAAPTYPRKLSALRRFKLRELVRSAARHVLCPIPAEQETAEWSDLAQALVEAALGLAVERLREEGRWPLRDCGTLAVMALGRFGGRDLNYSSDLDMLYVYEAEGGPEPRQYELLAQAASEALQAVTEEGRLFEVDLRLRPEGRQGFSAASLQAARRYYGEGGRALTWEFQMLTRLRRAAGSEQTAAAFREIVAPRVYRSPMPPEWRAEIRAMKRRIERERVREGERDRHLKLGPGGLSDIEFLVQLLQLEHGAEHPALRAPSTAGAVRALAGAGVFTPAEAETLLAGHAFLTRLRQSLYLLRGEDASDALPAGPEALVPARAMGFPDPAALDRAYRERAEPVRALFLRFLE